MDQTSLRHAATVNIHPGSYVVNSIPRGLVLIINIEEYKLGVEGDERRGSTLDAARLRRLLEEFSYHVSVHDNNTADYITNLVKDFSRKEEFKYVDAAIVVVLAHGSDGEIIASDGERVSIMELLRNFCADQCPLLAGKPKFFIFQACRGTDSESGYIFSKEAQQDSQFRPAPQGEIVCPIAYQPKPDTQSSFSDYLIAYPTVQGYAAWRTRENGSPFIQRLEEVFRNDSHNEQVLDMLYAVSKHMAKQPIVQALTGERHFQTSQIECTLRKPFYFWTDDLSP
ncbi:unnamed protein product [Calicophoron daubneyi]|uniref:Caspase-3 n=1 Tax=Calicophoron daubneyi TaxID=300641 RepID=A0AAV2T8P2_CALDB